MKTKFLLIAAVCSLQCVSMVSAMQDGKAPAAGQPSASARSIALAYAAQRFAALKANGALSQQQKMLMAAMANLTQQSSTPGK